MMLQHAFLIEPSLSELGTNLSWVSKDFQDFGIEAENSNELNYILFVNSFIIHTLCS